MDEAKWQDGIIVEHFGGCFLFLPDGVFFFKKMVSF